MKIVWQKLELLQWIVKAENEVLLRYLFKLRMMHEQATDWASLLKAGELETVYNKLIAVEHDSKK
ncbi:MAG: hypothetical protein H0S84_06400 [Bacteroidales bacterium]|jgi:hypothetical protein|nr:hypothetical protein [Bacteroidales bacterium]MDN5348895.1 hypothetical protein [Bacteroidales bacterium]